MICSEADHPESLLRRTAIVHKRSVYSRVRCGVQQNTMSHGRSERKFGDWKTCPYPRTFSFSDAAGSQSCDCAGTFPCAVRLNAYPHRVSTFFRLAVLNRRRNGKCIGGPNTVSTMMQLLGSSCGEPQIAKQKDSTARCRIASCLPLFVKLKSRFPISIAV